MEEMQDREDGKVLLSLIKDLRAHSKE